MRATTEDKPPLAAFVARLALHSAIPAADAAAITSLPWKLMTRNQNFQLVREGDLTRTCLVLLDGFAYRFRVTEDGRRQILSVYIPGDPLNFDQAFLPIADDALQTLGICRLAQVSHEDLRALMIARPAAAEAITRALLVDASIFREWTLNVGRRDARTKIAHLLCEISTRLAAQGFDFEATPLPLTQDQIADATGLTSVHVNRTLRSMSSEGLLRRRRGLVILPEPDVLQSAAGFDPRYLHLTRGED